MGKKKGRRKQRIKRNDNHISNLQIVNHGDYVYDEIDKFNMEYDENILKLVKTNKPLAKEVLRVASDDDVTDEELIEETPADQSRDVITTNKWGKRRQNYYGASSVSKTGTKNDSEEEEILQLEEKDALNRQHKLELANSFIDYDQLLISSKNSNENGNQQEGLTTILEITSKPIVVRREENETGNSEEGEFNEEDFETASNYRNLGNKIEKERRRAITYEIRKNKGIAKDKGRRKGKQHSRVMKRHQFKKALIKKRSQVPDVLREMTRYGGEKRGIRISTIKSIKL